jgi:hypothetical protein
MVIFFFCVAFAAAIIAGLEIFLSEQQKRWLDRKVLQLWNWLDDCKRISLLAWLKQKVLPLRVFSIAMLLSCAFILWVWWKSQSPNDPTELYGTIAVLLLLASIFGSLIIRSSLRSTTLLRALLRITVYAVVCLTPFYAFLYWTAGHQALLTVRPLTVLQILYVLGFFAVTIFTAFMLIFWSTVAVPILSLYLTGLLLFVSEFVVRRIAEYPKGVLIAMSALMASLFAFVRVFK